MARQLPANFIREEGGLIHRIHSNLLTNVISPIILEVGAADGFHTQLFLDEFKQCQLHCFEPDPRGIAEFKKHIDDPRCHLYELAISAEDGQTTFHQSGGTTKGAHLDDWYLSGSIRKPTGHLQMSPWCKFDHTITVPTRSLDNWAAEHLTPKIVSFIWVDIQGAEIDLISGGKQTLARTRYVRMEYYNTPMYEGQQNMQGLLAALGHNWKVLPEFCDRENFMAENTLVS